MKTKKKKEYGSPNSVRIAPETMAIFDKYFPSLKLPGQIAQMAWEFDQLKQAQKKSRFSYNQNQRFQRFLDLADRDKSLNSLQLAETMEDFINYEESEGEMTFDTFKERLEIRLKN